MNPDQLPDSTYTEPKPGALAIILCFVLALCSLTFTGWGALSLFAFGLSGLQGHSYVAAAVAYGDIAIAATIFGGTLWYAAKANFLGAAFLPLAVFPCLLGWTVLCTAFMSNK
jgi:hypothetical protein